MYPAEIKLTASFLKLFGAGGWWGGGGRRRWGRVRETVDLFFTQNRLTCK